MGKRNDFQSIAEDHEYDVVRELVNRHSADGSVLDFRNDTADLRELLDELQRLSNLGDEPFADARVASAIPGGRFA